MKSYFNDHDLYTKTANRVSAGIRGVLLPIYENEESKGFSLRELTHLVVTEAFALEAEKVLRQGVKRHKEKRNG